MSLRADVIYCINIDKKYRLVFVSGLEGVSQENWTTWLYCCGVVDCTKFQYG